MSSIQFGTDGWRRHHRRRFYIRERAHRSPPQSPATLCAAKPRAGACSSATTIATHPIASPQPSAEVISSSGTPVWLSDKPCPTPAISLLVRQRQAAGGIVITASHNPYSWNGIKYKASYGSSALPSIVAQIENELETVLSNGVPPLPPRKDLIHSLEPREPYLDTIEKLIDWQRLRDSKFRFVADPMPRTPQPASCTNFFNAMASFATKSAALVTPRFGGGHPEPIEPHIDALRKAVLTRKI